ncbi:Argonaute siRNA chaperone complex subunit Arb1-domain-containing protein [Emericellopsis atlantica]|uniref:Argonaute siRNA chaperone complex subunit Arb1-domain-containing protein n=1 Tax=Emericellopsis atlantica TaxID=2614577 RepID=A0A9P8CP46_9HYPO|nr:Argonaute siRNA chaperone complex subunit Arb1-domain-containing protein [Emericellopsis atlantica]KAG9253812.1 Argonaute siRNA chaperone complex subunit Arb1-domain-containing protein [Emericellopsis atlantica]
MTDSDPEAPVCASHANEAVVHDQPASAPKVADSLMEDPSTEIKTKKRKKKKGKTAAARGATALAQSRGTGLEEFFADAPMTPQEAKEEEENVYSVDLPFEERIQSCITRFRTRRRLQAPYDRFFNEYLFLGGIDSNPNPFGGQDPKALKSLTPAERREATATSHVHQGEGDQKFYNGDDEHWSVDFAGVAAGFFSYMVPKMTGLEETSLKQAVNVVDNFLRYVLQHDVCPEYEDDVKKAIQVCEDALVEWPMMVRLQGAFPGLFNLAATKVFGVYDESDWYMADPQKEDFDPKLVLMTSLTLLENPKDVAKLPQPHHRVIRQFDCTVEISDIQRLPETLCKRFKGLQVDGSPLRLAPIGKIRVIPAIIEDELVHPKVSNPFAKGFMTLYLDDDILANMKVGMKMETTVCQTDSDLKFIKAIRQIVPSFYTFLPQELMRHFREPRPNDRPARSVHDIVDDGSAEWEAYQEKLKAQQLEAVAEE